MNKEIVWTISYGDHCLVMETRNKECDEKDRKIEVRSMLLVLFMKRLSMKYCNRGYAVLFDVDC